MLELTKKVPQVIKTNQKLGIELNEDEKKSLLANKEVRNLVKWFIDKGYEFDFSDPQELVKHITAFYGLRRSEVLELKWSAIDFENKMININRKVVRAGKTILGKNKMKNKTSNRTLPLVHHIEEILIKAKALQEQNKQLFGNTYCQNYLDYVCVNPMGYLLKPNFLTQHFRRIQNNHNLKQIRFHDLRHSCASLMLANNVPMKQIQEWLGHSTFQTTADMKNRHKIRII